MKIFLPIFFILITFQTFAQNYRTINTTQISYYENGHIWFDEIFPMKVDSFKVNTNSDTICYLNQVFPDFNELQHPYDSVLQQNCLQTAYLAWHGEKVLLQQNGNDVYFDRNNEPITIKTNANLGETWVMYDEAFRIEATIYEIGTATILGVLDSVKYFSLQYYDSLNTLTYTVLDYQLSENYGLVNKRPAFRDFPNPSAIYYLKGVQTPKLGVYNIERNDVYNFDIGDEFHIEEERIMMGSNRDVDYYKVIINNKTLDSLGNWSYDYDVVRHVSTFHDFILNTFSVEEISPGLVPISLIPTPIVDNLPRTFYVDFLWQIGGYSTIYKSQFPNRIGKDVDFPYSDFDNDGCWTDILVSASVPNSFVEGLGGPYGQGVGSVNTSTILVYYKKGNEIYGTPIDFDLIMPTETIISESENLKIYPNPAQSFINIELENQSNLDFNILIVNSLGQIVSQGILTQNFQQIPVNHLPKGIYTLHIRNEETSYVKRFIKN